MSLTSLLLVIAGCGKASRPTAPSSIESQGNGPIRWQALSNQVPSAGGPLFERLPSSQTGIDFRHQGIPREKQNQIIYASGTSGGVCIGDYDDDGLADVFLTQPFGTSRLYRNRGDFRFEDVTVRAGLEDRDLWGMGATFVDIDNDSDLDLFACGYDCPNRLYVNSGDGTFKERAQQFGLDFNGASVMMAFADYDRDGDLDGYLVTNRLADKGPAKHTVVRRNGQWMVHESARESKDVLVRPGGGVVLVNAGQFDHLYRNDGDGTFTDVSQAAGIRGNYEGLSAVWFDANADGFPDFYVANDNFGPDQLMINNGDGTFTDCSKGWLPHTPWTSMGCDAADINNDGRMDLMSSDMSATTHYKSRVTMGHLDPLGWFLLYPEPRQYMRNAVYLSTGADRFMEVAHMTGLANTNWTWAIKFADLDNDGWVDLFASNGMTRDFNNTDLMLRASVISGGAPLVPETVPFWLNSPRRDEENLAFKNMGDLRFESVGNQWGLNHKGISFGAAVGDLDNDGDLDLVTNDHDAPAGVYRNRSTNTHRLTIGLKGTRSNRYGIGATVTIETDSGPQTRYLTLASGFMSASQPRIHFGLGQDDMIRRLTVQWPSDQRQSFENLPADRHYLIVEPETASTTNGEVEKKSSTPWFRRADMPGGARHREAAFDDFRRQPLLPNRLSQLGPGMAWGDVNGDGTDDLYLGGAKGQVGGLYYRVGNGEFQATGIFPWIDGELAEDMGAALFDSDGDDDLDLYVVSGSVECEANDAALRDRLYLNDGKGGFTRAPEDSLPDLRDSGSAVAVADFDRDGDLDLFVGGRSIPGQYPLTPNSRLLANDRGRFRDVTDQVAPGLRTTGLVTGAIWSDVDDDGWLDLLVTHEWGPVKLWWNRSGTGLVDRTASAGLADRTGWWNGIAGADIDHDGDVDFAVTNFGLNTKYQPTPTRPIRIFYGDFDETGRRSIVESYTLDRLLPRRGKSYSQKAMPFLKARFSTFHDFATSGLEEIYGADHLAKSYVVEANTLHSGLLINDGHGHFTFRPLPRMAQVSPAFGVVFSDVDSDGCVDLYLAQNFYGPHHVTGRMDGGVSLLLKGAGDGTFRPVWPSESGLVVPGDAKSLATTDLNDDGWIDFVIGMSNEPPLAFVNQTAPGHQSLQVRLEGAPGNRQAIGARVKVHLDDGRTQTAEIHCGGSYLTQYSRKLVFGLGRSFEARRIEVRWPDGTSTDFAPDAKQPNVVIRRYPDVDRSRDL